MQDLLLVCIPAFITRRQLDVQIHLLVLTLAYNRDLAPVPSREASGTIFIVFSMAQSETETHLPNVKADIQYY